LLRGAALTAQRLAAAIQSEEDERARRVAALHAIRDESIAGSVAIGGRMDSPNSKPNQAPMATKAAFLEFIAHRALFQNTQKPNFLPSVKQ
jgi:hypothetical protein